MKLIAHRCNTLAVFSANNLDAIEFDVRDSNGQLIVTHDPYKDGPLLDTFLKAGNGCFFIVNVKSAGIESDVLQSLKDNAPNSEFFLLDCTVPAMVSLVNSGETRFAVRYSEMEPLESVLVWEGKAEWVWVDCFSQYILTKETVTLLKERGFKLCLVSPELQGRPLELQSYVESLCVKGIKPDAVCTKSYNFYKWKCLQDL